MYEYGDDYGVRPGVKTYDNPFDEIEAGGIPADTDFITVAQGQVLKRGAVLGRVTATGEYVLSAKAAADGSEKPRGILLFGVDASAGAKKCERFVAGRFFGTRLTLGAGWTVPAVAAAFDGTPIHVLTYAP